MFIPKLKSRARTRGLSLVELMVSMAIGLFLVTIIAMVFANSSNSQKELTQASQQIENGRYAIDLLSDDLRHAGFFGHYHKTTDSGTNNGLYSTSQTSLPDPCSIQVADLFNGLDFPVQGYNSPTHTGTFPITCLAVENHIAGTDIVVIRRASTEVTPIASLNANTIYIQSSPLTTVNPVIALGSSASSFSLSVRNGSGTNVVAPIRALETHIYYVSPCSNPAGATCTASDDGGRPIPTLKRIELTNGTSGAVMKAVSLVEGIQNLQVEYGVDKFVAGTPSPATPGDGQPDGSYVTLPASITEWANVMAVHAYVLARNSERSNGFTDNKTYVMGATSVVAPGDNYKRHLFNAVVRLKNPSERQEK